MQSITRDQQQLPTLRSASLNATNCLDGFTKETFDDKYAENIIVWPVQDSKERISVFCRSIRCESCVLRGCNRIQPCYFGIMDCSNDCDNCWFDWIFEFKSVERTTALDLFKSQLF